MKPTFVKITLTLVSTFIISFTAFAQQTPFTGTWTQKEKTNLSGTDYSNAIPVQIKLEQSAAEITLNRTEVGPDEDTAGPTSTEKLTLETGKGTIGTTADNRKIKTASLIAGKTLTEVKVITLPNSDKAAMNIKEIFTLSDDGKTLTLIKNFENTQDANDKWSVKGVFGKQ